MTIHTYAAALKSDSLPAAAAFRDTCVRGRHGA